MAIAALNTSATAMTALSTNIDIIANNLANVNTNGFKASRANFEDLLYDQKRQPGLDNAGGAPQPAGLQVGLGTRLSNTQLDLSPGAVVPTGKPFDLMVNGNGFFKVKTLESQGGGLGYTRAGNFLPNSDGDLVLGTTDGPLLEPAINIPPDATNVSVASDGTVSYVPNGQNTSSVIGRLTLTSFLNPNGLQAIGGNLYIESPASGPGTEGNPGDAAFGTLLQGQLEASNVDPVAELVSLIKAQRAFELNSKTIQAADETLQVVSNLKRF